MSQDVRLNGSIFIFRFHLILLFFCISRTSVSFQAQLYCSKVVFQMGRSWVRKDMNPTLLGWWLQETSSRVSMCCNVFIWPTIINQIDMKKNGNGGVGNWFILRQTSITSYRHFLCGVFCLGFEWRWLDTEGEDGKLAILHCLSS